MISAEYFDCLRATRAAFPYWGSGGVRHAAPVLALLEELGVRQGTILDYGSGVGAFALEMRKLAGARYSVVNYEPTLPQWSVLMPGPYDAVVCTHVLEHVEPELLEDTLLELRARATRLAYIEVPHGPAKEELVDGRNAHLIVEDPEFWLERIVRAFAGAASITSRASMLKNQTTYTVRL